MSDRGDGKTIGELLAGVLQFTLSLFARDADLRVLIIVRNQRTGDQYEIANVETISTVEQRRGKCDRCILADTILAGEAAGSLLVLEAPE